MTGNIFQTSDLARNRVQVLDAARAGRARLRDKDGTSLVMLPEEELEALESYATWSQKHQRLARLLSTGSKLTVEGLEDLAWLRVFDRDDIEEFSRDLYQALVAGLADRDSAPVDETVAAWRVTARQLQDPLRREVLTGHRADADFVEAPEPN